MRFSIILSSLRDCKPRITRATFYFLLFTLLASCASPTPAPQVFPTFILITQDPNASPTPTPFQPSGQVNTPLPTFTQAPPASATSTITFTPIPTLTFTPPPPTPTIDSAPTAVPPPTTPSRTNYILSATLDFDAHTLDVDETIRYYNNTGVALSDIVLSVQPNRYGGAFNLSAIFQDNAALTTYSLNDQRLTLNLPQALQPNSATTLGIKFKLDVPAKSSTGIFGYDFNQINLVDWYPFVVPREAVNGWVLHDPMPFGEHLVYDSSDIELNLKTGSDVVIAASAPAEQNGEWTRYRLYGARTFALSASDEFLVSESAVGTVVIRSYYFDGYKAAGESILYSAVQAVSIYSAKFAPYPYETLAVVQTDIHDGQEYDGLVFLASDFYGQYGGGAKNNLTTIGIHEIAHQWWFGLVGNDQAAEPWLDEAMATYSERIFFEYNYPRYGDWWWQYRVDYFGASGYVDIPIYSGGSFRTYTNAVYLNGAHFMEDLRVRMGDDDFFRFLKDYAARYSRGRATSYDFFTVVRQNTTADISDLIAEYFSGSY
ncbi:MAG: M1 family aminopeptidase [Anaerolineales bacterium]|nr:M1 family aminopeptidase [Anaerolineales bacterium]